MRGNNRKSIEKCGKRLPQFTTMNVIDGQAGLVIYSSLIFYSLTIDNILNIIVLLILAGVSIATLMGDNGILTRVNDAKEETKSAENIEKIKLAILAVQMGKNGYQELTTENLGSELIKDKTKAIVSDNEDGSKHILFLNEKKEYKLDTNGNIENLNINFDTKYVVPSSQDEERNEGVLGIGTDGNPVDMDLWEYTKLDDGTYALNDSLSLIENENYVATSAYKGNYTNGIIEEELPIYISEDKGKNFFAVTSLENTFRYDTNIYEMPIIPYTVENMRNTFADCTQLINVTSIPSSVTSMYGTFARCSSLTTMPFLNNKVDMSYTFLYCINLIHIKDIPENVTILEGTFANCTKLNTMPIISSKVENIQSIFENCFELNNINLELNNCINMTRAFYGCTKLSGKIIINNNPNKYTQCFEKACTDINSYLILKGKSSILRDLQYTKSENSHIEIN